MSHAKERKEKSCLNCNAVVHGRYCSICGQENLEPQETTGHLISHFFNDITHFDGKFFSSLKYLLFKPGFLTSEYVAGRRTSYLNPVRMYVFVSFIFFLIFFSLTPAAKFNAGTARYNPAIRDSVFTAFNNLKSLDSAELKAAKSEYDRIVGKTFRDSARKAELSKKSKKDSKVQIDVGEKYSYESRSFRDLKEYDSLVAIDSVNDNFLTRSLTRKELKLEEKYGHDSKRINERIMDNFIHSIPQMFFLSLPLLAIFLKLLYVRRRKKFYYVSHVIFCIHLFVFTYIAMLLIIGVNLITRFETFQWLTFLKTVIILLIGFYWYKAMKNFYNQGTVKTIFKFLLVLLSLIFIALLSVLIIGLFAYYKS